MKLVLIIDVSVFLKAGQQQLATATKAHLAEVSELQQARARLAQAQQEQAAVEKGASGGAGWHTNNSLCHLVLPPAALQR